MTDTRANPNPPSQSDSRRRRVSSALDGLNFFLADVRDGMGPFLGTFLREHQHWDAGRVGIALAASQIGTVLAQTPAGALIDRISWKRLAVAIAAAVVAAGCVMLYLVPTLAVVVAAQAAIGAAAAIFPPAVAALTLGPGRPGGHAAADRAKRGVQPRRQRRRGGPRRWLGLLPWLRGDVLPGRRHGGRERRRRHPDPRGRNRPRTGPRGRRRRGGGSRGRRHPRRCSRTGGSRSSPPRPSCSTSPMRRCCRWSARSPATA